MTKLNLKKSVTSYDVIVITSPKNVTKLTSKIFPFWAPPSKISGYTPVDKANTRLIIPLTLTVKVSTGVMVLKVFCKRKI